MLKEFLSKFESIEKAKTLFSLMQDLIDHFENDYIKNKNFKNAVIDELCEYLQTLKEK